MKENETRVEEEKGLFFSFVSTITLEIKGFKTSLFVKGKVTERNIESVGCVGWCTYGTVLTLPFLNEGPLTKPRQSVESRSLYRAGSPPVHPAGKVQGLEQTENVTFCENCPSSFVAVVWDCLHSDLWFG